MDSEHETIKQRNGALSCVYLANGQIECGSGPTAKVEILGLEQRSAEDHVVFVRVVHVDGANRFFTGPGHENRRVEEADIGVHVFTEFTRDPGSKLPHIRRAAGVRNQLLVSKQVYSADADGVIPLILSRNADQKMSFAASSSPRSRGSQNLERDRVARALNDYFSREPRSETVIGFVDMEARSVDA